MVTLFRNIGLLATMDDAVADESHLGCIPDAELLVDDSGRVAALGPRGGVAAGEGAEVVDLGGACAMPGLVESHTHVVYAGDRLLDFAERCSGVSYEAIAKRGGGIQTTVRATRAASEEELIQLALPRLDGLLASGATTVEVKSGYGLEPETELKMLRVIRRLNELHPVDVVATFLGAHTVPTSFGVDRETYLGQVIEEMLPQVAEEGLAEFCDVFCETSAFSIAETRRVLEAGMALGLRPKVHAEQLTRSGGASLAAALGAASADHLEFIEAQDIAAMAAAGTVATLLPGASLFLGGKAWPPARALLDGGVQVALSTDCNPGSANTTHLFLMGTLACSVMGMAPHEALRGLTVAGAAALDRADTVGTLATGKLADLIVLDVARPEGALYAMASSPVKSVYKRGRRVFHAG